MIVQIPDNDKYQQFYFSTLRLITVQAFARYPQDEQTLKKAALLVFDGHVDLLEYSALVTSSDGIKTYLVNGACECQAYQHGQQRCKHRWAATIARKLQTALDEHKAIWETTYSTALRDDRAIAGNDVAIVCNGPIGEVVDGNGEVHALGYQSRNNGQYSVTAGK